MACAFTEKDHAKATAAATRVLQVLHDFLNFSIVRFVHLKVLKKPYLSWFKDLGFDPIVICHSLLKVIGGLSDH